uniref:SUEL-type lectin domain-containing protein n=1 Tax=Trichobilharzia regenti TaxID=157069 RepID=A0AA85KIF2_TRIRE|nr:unnamed protein product [Trichobilharzia regenti]
MNLMILYCRLCELIVFMVFNHVGNIVAVDNFQFSYSSKHIPGEMDRSDVFRKPSLLVCPPDPLQLHCPSHMYIKPSDAEIIRNIQTAREPEFISPSCSFKASQPENTRKQELSIRLQTECNLKMIEQICEGRSSCELQISQLIPNASYCFEENSSVLVTYQCLPDPNSALFEAICADTYMEVNCNTQRNLNALVILGAEFEKEIKSSGKTVTNGCSKLPVETPVGIPDTLCSLKIDITDYISHSCDGRTSCSVNPNTIELATNEVHKCGKMHLSLVYVCAPPEFIIAKKYVDNPEERHTEKQKTNQRQPKEIQSLQSGNKISFLNPNDVSVYTNEPLSTIRLDKESDISKPLTGLRKSAYLQMNSRSSEILYKGQDSYSQPVSPSILQSSLIGFGGGLLILLCIVFIVLLICHKSGTRNDFNKSRQNRKPNKYSTVCLAHSNNDWSTMNSTALHPAPMSDGSVSNDIKLLCPGCKLPTNPCSLVTDIHKYRNEKCQCRANIQGGINMCSVHHDSNNHSDREHCYPTQPTLIGHQNSPELYAMKVMPSTSNQTSCIFSVCPMQMHDELNMPLSTHTVHSVNSGIAMNEYLPAATSSINNIHYDYHTRSSLDQNIRPELTQNLIENIYINKKEYGINTLKAPPSVNSGSTGRGCDGGSGISERSEEVNPKLNLYAGFSRFERKNDYDNVNERRIYDYKDNEINKCHYEMHSCQLRVHNEYSRSLLRSSSNRFCSQDDCQHNTIDKSINIKLPEKYHHYAEGKSVFESNMQLNDSSEQSSKSLHQICSNHNEGDYTMLTKGENVYHPCLTRKISFREQSCNNKQGKPQQTTHFSENITESVIQQCESVCKESTESLSVPLIDPPHCFRTPANKLRPSNDECTSIPTHKPPDVILKSVGYNDDDWNNPHQKCHHFEEY